MTETPGAGHGPDLPTWLTSTLASDAAGGSGVMNAYVRPLRSGLTGVGFAVTLAVAEGDNLHFKEALEHFGAAGAAGGSVLVIGGSPTAQRAVMGGILAAAVSLAGFTAVVTDGVVRDSAEIIEMGLRVWCRGTTPVAATKNGPGGVGGTILCAGVAVDPGDAVVADDDGVVVWPRARIPELIESARQRRDADSARLARVRAGQGL